MEFFFDDASARKKTRKNYVSCAYKRALNMAAKEGIHDDGGKHFAQQVHHAAGLAYDRVNAS